jgi:DNA-binding MarR family transcriptional regulator
MPAKNQNDAAPKFSLAAFLPYRLAVATESVGRVFAESFGNAYNLNRPEWRILAVIVEHGTQSPTMVGQRSALDKVKVSRAVQSLVTKGLLRRTRDPDDGRGLLLSLTRKGAATHAGLIPLSARTEATVFEGLNQADRAALSRILKKITTHLETIDGTGTRTRR